MAKGSENWKVLFSPQGVLSPGLYWMYIYRLAPKVQLYSLFVHHWFSFLERGVQESKQYEKLRESSSQLSFCWA